MEKKIVLLFAAFLTHIAMSNNPPALTAGEPEVLRDCSLWLDARDAFGSNPADEMIMGWNKRFGWAIVDAEKPFAPPFLRYDKENRAYVDFGKFSSGRDLSINPREVGIRTAFIVGKLGDSRYCHFLCDSKGYDFHRGANGEYASREWSPKISRIWNGTNEVADIYSEFPPTGVTQVFCIETSAPCACDSLSADRISQFHERSGGRELREVILFNRVLSDAEGKK